MEIHNESQFNYYINGIQNMPHCNAESKKDADTNFTKLGQPKYKNSYNIPNQNCASKKKHMKKMFTDEEDKKIIDAVAILSKQKSFCWTQVSDIVGGGRTARQCRERYKHYLDPRIKNPEWSTEEDILLEQKYAEYGPHWSIIAKFFKNRTDVNIKNRWAVLSIKIQKIQRGNFKNYSIPYVKTFNKLCKNHCLLRRLPQSNIVPVVNEPNVDCSVNETNFCAIDDEPDYFSVENIEFDDFSEQFGMIDN